MISIQGVRLDDPQHVFVIAEMSGNHAHDYGKAEALVRAAAQAGADAIKVQTFEGEDICVDMPFPYGHSSRQDAWARGLGVTTMRDLLSKGGLPRVWHAPLKILAESLGLLFLSTAFSVMAAKFLVENLRVPALKIASGDLTFTPLLEFAASTGLPLIVSTGGATMAECLHALQGPLWPARDRLVFLHCVSVYPAEPSMLNLRCIGVMQECLGIPIGFSDHTLRVDVPALAVAAGAVVIEKHVVLNRNDGSIDAAHSLEPAEFTRMIGMIRETDALMGDGVKEPHAAELHDRLFARRDPSDFLRPMMRGRLGDWE